MKIQENDKVRFEEHQINEKADTLTIYFTHECDENVNADDVQIDDESFDLSEFKSWVLDTVKEDDSFDLGGVLPNGLTFSDFWDTLSVSQQTEWVKDYLSIQVSEGVVSIRQFPVVVYQKAA